MFRPRPITMIRILFLGDDPLTLQLLDKASALLGHQAVVATNAQIALDMIAEECPDLILADLNMPGNGGLAFLKQVRSQYPHLPVLIVSAGMDEAEMEQVMAAGANGTIEKPLSIDKLADLIDQHIQAKQ